MIYNPKQIKQQKGLSCIKPKTFLHDGINYQVYISEENVLKHYQTDDIPTLNQLLQTIDQELIITSKSSIFIAPLAYEIINYNTLYDVYLLYSSMVTIQKFIDSTFDKIQTSYKEQIKLKDSSNEDLELYNQLLGESQNDEEDNQILKLQEQQYTIEKQQQLYQQVYNQYIIAEEQLRQMLIQTVITFYELEKDGIVIPSITLPNTLIQDNNLKFMDIFNKSSNFELTLEEYLMIENASNKFNNPFPTNPVKKLGIIFLSLIVLLYLGEEQEQNINDYIQSATSYSQNTRNLISKMVSNQIKFFHKLIETDEFIQFANMTQQSLLDSIYFEFHVRPLIKTSKAIDRIEEKRIFDQLNDFWNSTIKLNLNFLTKKKSEFQHQQYIKFKIEQVLKCQSVILCMDIITIETDLTKFAKGIVSITQTGDILFFDYYDRYLIKSIKCSQKQLYQVRKIRPKYICIGGEDTILYILSKDDNYSSIQQKKIHKSPIYSINSTQNDMGKFLLSGDRLGKVVIQLVEKDDFQIYREIQAHGDRVQDIMFKNRYDFFTCSFEKKIKLWDLRKLDEMKVMLVGHQAEIISLYYSNSFLYSFSIDCSMRVWEWKNEIFNFIYQSKFEEKIKKAILLTENQLLFIGNKSIHIYNLKERKVTKSEKIHLNEITDIQFVNQSINGLVTSSYDSTMKFLKIEI